MSRSAGPLAYVIQANDPANNDMRPFARITCAKCGFMQKLNVTGTGNNPEKIEKTYIRLGWDCNVHKPSSCLCPKCVRQREIQRAGDKPDTPIMAKPRPPGLMDNIKMGAGTRKPSTPVEDKTMTLRDLQPAQKASLRTALESYFDPDKGQYSDGMNDHTISEELGIPRVLVIEFRESFYGELKEDPEVRAFKMQMDDARKVMSNLEETFKKMEAKLALLLRKNGLS